MLCDAAVFIFWPLSRAWPLLLLLHKLFQDTSLILTTRAGEAREYGNDEEDRNSDDHLWMGHRVRIRALDRRWCRGNIRRHCPVRCLARGVWR